MPRFLSATVLATLGALALSCAGPPPGAITAAASAARLGDTTTIAQLAAAGYDLNTPDPGLNHWTPLLHAIHKSQPASVDALIAAGADVSRAAPGGTSPLEMAAANGNLIIVRRLLAAGANPHAPGVFAAAVSGGAMTDIEQPLLGRCNTEIVRALLARAPDLRLPDNPRGHLSLLFARLNHCGDIVCLVRF